MLLIVGLGNPGAEYKNNRHNTGFMAADEIVRRYNFSAWKSGFTAQYCTGTIGTEKVIVLKPETFMNNSGQSVRAIMDFYKLQLSNIYVLHDDLDLPVGKIKAKVGGGAGGHNGLKSIDAHCGVNYTRIRIGIDHPPVKDQVVNWVLGNFSSSDKEKLEEEFTAIADTLPVLFEKGTGDFTSQYALKMKG